MVTKLTIEYDGTDFCGWARQPGGRSVQEELERALRTILGEYGSDGEPLRLTVAGRTDAGVHAWAQIASYAHEAVDPVRLNGLLPADVAVLSSEPAPVGFDARRHATSRTYCYRVLARRTRSVFERNRAYWYSAALDRAALSECASALAGRHDFRAFTPTETEHVRFEREVFAAEWSMGSELLEFWIEADTFMRHMNRALVGTMLEVASGRRSLEQFLTLLGGAPRSEAGRTAPAHGLALASVCYRAPSGRRAAPAGASGAHAPAGASGAHAPAGASGAHAPASQAVDQGGPGRGLS